MSEDTARPTIRIYVDADACPVKDEVYRVAGRYGLHVFVVSNSFLNLPREPWIERVVVGDKFDAADDWIAERASPGAIVITADVPLASRCVKAGAVALAPNGKAFTDASVGLALATRNLMQDLREAGAITGGPKPFSPKDRSAFLGALDRVIVRLNRDLKI
ncbi:YaiI/YqxD family protein [Methylorubrum aminovorans]